MRSRLKNKRNFGQAMVGLLLAIGVSVGAALLVVLALQQRSESLSIYTYVVQSGSMAPSIMTGDMIIIRPQTAYAVNDTITFRASDDRIVTHRISEISPIEPTRFITKGDANPELDTNEVALSQVLGTVIMVLPRVGHFVTFASSTVGIVVFLVVPATILIVDELWLLFKRLAASR